MPSALERIRQVATRDRTQRFTTLFHRVYAVARLRTAYLALKRTAAEGVDGETWQHYGQDLEANLEDLSARLQRRNETFFRLAALNTAIRGLLDALNDRPLQKLGISRRTLYDQLDRSALQPPARYVLAEWKRCRVNIFCGPAPLQRALPARP